MKMERCTMPSFAVIGKEGSSDDGKMFVSKLWEEANSHFHEVEQIAQRDENGELLGFWGAMTDCSRSFQPWEEGFTKGLYLAGVQCETDAEAPAGWVKWTIPAFEYLYTECTEADTFERGIRYLAEHHIVLAGAVQDFICPQTGKNYMFFPVEKH